MQIGIGLSLVGDGRTRAWLPSSLSSATLVYDADGSLSGSPGATYLNGAYYNRFADAGGSYAGGGGNKTSQNSAGLLTGPYADGIAGETDAGVWIGADATNLATYSGVGSNAGWLNQTATGKSSGATDPFGGAGAVTFTADGTTANHVAIAPNANFVSGVAYALSVYIKAGSSSRVQLTGSGGAFGSTAYANFLLSGAGSVTGSTGVGTPNISRLGNTDWYRCWIVPTATATTNAAALIFGFPITGAETRLPSNSAAGSFTAFGSQAEASSAPTPLILTSSTSKQRNADQFSIVAPIGSSSATIIYDGGTASPSVTAGAVFNFGSTSGGAWVGSRVQRVVIL